MSEPITNPAWLGELAGRLDPLETSWGPPVGQGIRRSAVIALLSRAPEPDLVLTARSTGLAHHAGQISMPGGGREPGDASPADTALREMEEEIGLRRAGVETLGQLVPRTVGVSRNRVVPIVGVWSGDEPICAADTGEVAAVLRWPLAELADPAHRVTARHPGRPTSSPAWQMGDWFLWGFTAWVVDALLQAGGWEREWDTGRLVDIPKAFRGNWA